MAIRVTCNACGERLSAPEAHAGKPARCPACKGVLTVPLLSLRPPNRRPSTAVLDELH